MQQNLFFSFILVIFCLPHISLAASNHNISAIFAFGDSILDAGNNNLLPTVFRANHAPYGLDFPGRVPTGRFSDGKIVTDFFVSSLGIKEALPAYAAAIDGMSANDLATGVTFASGGAGLDDLTSVVAFVLTIGQQLGHFRKYMKKLETAVGGVAAGEVVKDALFVIGAGSNDWVTNYYMTPLRSQSYNVSAYSDLLIDKIVSTVQELYNEGARLFAISGLPPIGCLPFQITKGSLTPIFHPHERKCISKQNDNAILYNSKLQTSIKNMNFALPGSHVLYLDVYTPLMDMIINPQKYGFVITTVGCCGSGSMEMGPLCNIAQPLCQYPSKYMFWDSIHPSQATYQALANHFLKVIRQNLS